jgi:hypothetical protein
MASRSSPKVPDAAHQAGLLEAARLEGLRQEVLDRSLERRHLLGKALDRAAPVDVPLLVDPRDQPAVEALHDRVVLGPEGVDYAARVLRRADRKGQAPDLTALLAAQVVEELDEARDQVALGQHDIDRNLDLEILGQLLQTLSHGDRVEPPFLPALLGEVVQAEGDDDAVDRAAAAMLLQQLEEPGPGRAVDRPVAVLGGIAAGRVQQHGFVGEPPVAVPGAAHAANTHVVGAEPVGQGELQARILQRCRLARARRPYDEVPGELIELPPAPTAAELGLLEDRHGFPKALLEDRQLFL